MGRDLSDEPKGPSSTWAVDDDGNIVGPLEHLNDGNWAAEGEELAEVDLEALADMAKNMEVALMGRRPPTSFVSTERRPLAKFVFEVDRSKPLALGTVQARWVVNPLPFVAYPGHEDNGAAEHGGSDR